MNKYKIVEKKNPLAIHAYFDSMDEAKHHLDAVIPEHCAKGWFEDKSLKPEDFKIKEK